MQKSKYNMRALYESIEDRRPKLIKYLEAQALYQWVKNRNGKITQRVCDEGVYVRLIEPIQLPSRTYSKKEIFFFIQENERLARELEEVKDNLAWYKRKYDDPFEDATEGWNNGN